RFAANAVLSPGARGRSAGRGSRACAPASASRAVRSGRLQRVRGGRARLIGLLGPTAFSTQRPSAGRGVEHFPNLGRELLAAVRLAEKLNARIEPALVNEGILGIAG